MARRRRHHLVSRGYLRNFADGERVLLCSKATRTGKLVGTRDTFVESHFGSVLTDTGWNDEIEDEWTRLEDEALPSVRRLISGERGEHQLAAAKVLAAIHFVR